MGEAAKQSAITGSISDRGWVIIPTKNGDFLLQWGAAVCNGNGEDRGIINNYPIPFPNRLFIMLISHSGFSPKSAGILSYTAIDRTSFKAYSSVAELYNVTGIYMAIGC